MAGIRTRMVAAAGSAAFLLWVPVLADTSPPTLREDGVEAVQAGERLDPSRYGRGYIEHMDDVVERDLTRRALDDAVGRADDAEADRHGRWVIPSERSARFPRSGRRYVTNQWGDTRMAIGFPGIVDVHGAYVAGQGGRGVWTSGLRVVGYRRGVEVGRTAEFADIDDHPDWFAMNLRGVDRIVIEANAVLDGAGWYGLDDLTYTPHPGAEVPLREVVDFEDVPFRKDLTGSKFAGLTWEIGTGTVLDALEDAVPGPRPGPAFDGGNDLTPNAVGARVHRSVGTLPELVFDFQGVIRGDAGSFAFPPDSNGAIGPNHYVIAVNRNLAVYDRETGAELINVRLTSFLPGSNGDPRVLFDHFSQRWIVIVTDFSGGANIYVAVSRTDDATGSWFKGSFHTAEGHDKGCWPDYPTLGFDESGIYTSANMIQCGNTIWALEKAPLISENPSFGVITAFRDLVGGGIHPVTTFGEPGGEHFISTWGPEELRVRQLAGDITEPVLVHLGDVSVPLSSGPPDVPALGSDSPLATFGAIMNAVFRNGSIWACHDIDVDGRAAGRWYEIDPVALATRQVGTVSDPLLHYFYCAMAVNAHDDVVMGFTGAHAGQYAGTYYTGRFHLDPPGSMATPVQYKEGTGPQNNIDRFGRNRWGDYSLTVVDPADDLTFWTIQEYGHADDIWGTWVAQLGTAFPEITFNYPDGLPEVLDPSGDSIRVEIGGRNGAELDPASPTLHFDAGDGFVAVPMVLVSDGVYDAVFPAIECDVDVHYYLGATSLAGDEFTDPPGAPDWTHIVRANLGIVVYFEDDFEDDRGWTVESEDLTDGEWERGVPAGNGKRGDPTADFDGSGRCYLTGNRFGNSDVDGGPTRLISPRLDASGPVVSRVRYARWFTNDDQDEDRLDVEISNDDGETWTLLESVPHTTGWVQQSFRIVDFVEPTDRIRLRFSATDNPNNSMTEAAIDAVTLISAICAEGILGDVNGDGTVDLADLLLILAAWGDCPDPPEECPADLDEDGTVGLSDLLIVLANWGD